MPKKNDISLGKHLFNVVCIGLLISIPTGPLVAWLLGDWALEIYIALILPFLAIVAYMLYLSHLDDTEKTE